MGPKKYHPFIKKFGAAKLIKCRIALGQHRERERERQRERETERERESEREKIIWAENISGFNVALRERTFLLTTVT